MKEDKIKIIRVPLQEIENMVDDQNALLLLEKEDARIYLKTGHNKDLLTVEEVYEIVNTLKDLLVKNESKEDNLTEWLYRQWKSKEKYIENESSRYFNSMNWSQGWIPLIFIKQSKGSWEDGFIKLISSYLNVELFTVTISTSTMMTIVSNMELQFSKEKKDDISEFVQGIFEMLQNEWDEEVKVGVQYPAFCLQDVVDFGHQLLDDEKWVMNLWPKISFFTPWSHQLERIIAKVPREELNKYLAEYKLVDNELLKTLEVFIEESLNMSETARRLFIHRNTLQYRLDKVKQQIGLDAKKIKDAFLIKIILLLKDGLDSMHKNDNQ
ncbi:hypothetical protein BHF71_06210 [Vulcanibacillus modesticaldus]|uniref:PucR C-terminal helix-turn-helix domain-containing protein n=1 Tax=Vulcanibacillus modesticaldus TaxID=337097 RepID=A0A1D2YWT7_9BACI|nr:helix-turn-helix domain-containing protein [Vulcanibacillus modesticaldus]OEG00116.1 hypothetical protein BHF71_06210 [Vulcanibacillus modesticaldus]